MKPKLFNRITILFGLLLLITPLVQGQEVDTSINKTQQNIHDMFMQKHKTKKTVAGITLCGGVAIALIGVVALEPGDDIWGIESLVQSVTIIAGGATALISIPFFISAGSNKRKAKLALKREIVGIGGLNKSSNYGLSVTITF